MACSQLKCIENLLFYFCIKNYYFLYLLVFFITYPSIKKTHFIEKNFNRQLCCSIISEDTKLPSVWTDKIFHQSSIKLLKPYTIFVFIYVQNIFINKIYCMMGSWHILIFFFFNAMFFMFWCSLVINICLSTL